MSPEMISIYCEDCKAVEFDPCPHCDRVESESK